MILVLLACASDEVVLSFSPSPLDLGTVVFTPDMPEGGYAQAEVTVENTGEVDATLSLPPYDADHLCIEGFPDATATTEIGPLSPGSTYLLQVGICNHVAGEFGSEVTTTLDVLSGGEPARFTLEIVYLAELSTEEQ